MRIIYCIGSLDGKGGAERVLANKANYFADHLGYEIHILVNSHNKPSYAYQFSEAIKIHNMDIVSFLRKPIIPIVSYIFLQKKMLPIYQDMIKSINPDVIVVVQHGIDDYIIPKLDLPIPKIREFHYAYEANLAHSLLIKNPFKRWIFLKKKKFIINKFKKYDKLILLTESDKQSYNYGTDTYVIPNMIDLPLELNDNLVGRKKQVISVGSMHDTRKGFEIQIRLWKTVIKKHPDWCLNIYGDGKERQGYQKLIDQLKLNQNVILHGNTNNIYEKYNESAFFLFTSLAEGLPMVIIEAMSCGLPVIAFDCPFGPKEIIRDDVDGFVIQMNNEDELLDKLEYLIDNQSARLMMSRKAKEKSLYYSSENIAKIWAQFFESCTSN